MYEPREDSFLLLKHIKNYTNKNYSVLDLGTGSGLLALESSKYANKIIATDINENLIKELKDRLPNTKINFLVSDLFSNVKQRFPLILFNPPYLPSKKIVDIRIDGGKNGTAIIEKFLKQAKNHLEKNGKILLLCSSLNIGIEDLFKKYSYNFKKIDEKKTFFEKIYAYELKENKTASKF